MSDTTPYQDLSDRAPPKRGACKTALQIVLGVVVVSSVVALIVHFSSASSKPEPKPTHLCIEEQVDSLTTSHFYSQSTQISNQQRPQYFSFLKVHIARGHRDDEMVISWITPANAPAYDDMPVLFSTSPISNATGVFSQRGNTTQYTFTDIYPPTFNPTTARPTAQPMTGLQKRMAPTLKLAILQPTPAPVAEYTSGYIHHATITGLSGNTTYYYAINSKSCRQRSFTTMPSVGTFDSSVTIGVVGDVGQTPFSQQTYDNLMADESMRLILNAGDMAYADCNQHRWDSWGNMVEPLAERVPMMVAVGNHEIEIEKTETGYEYFKAFKNRFAMPRFKESYDTTTGTSKYCTPSIFETGGFEYGNSYYSFSAMSAHVIFLNSYTNSTKGSPQYQWLEWDLEQATKNRTATPWIFVVMHCPFYNSNVAHQLENQTVIMKQNIEELLFNHSVNIVFSGHVHAYERTKPVFKDEVNEKGIRYIVIGDGGNHEGHASNYKERIADWSVTRDGSHFGFGKIELFNATHMKWQWRSNDGNHSDTFVVGDEYIITNQLTWEASKQEGSAPTRNLPLKTENSLKVS